MHSKFAFETVLIHVKIIQAALHSTFSFSAQQSFCLWSAHFAEMCLESQAVFMWRHSLQVEIARKEETSNWLGILHKVSKIYFFQAIIHYTIFNARRIFGSKWYGSRATINQSDS